MNIDQHILRALRQEPDAGPPADFARRVAAAAAQIHGARIIMLATHRRIHAAAAENRMLSYEECAELRGLVAVFVLSALVVGAMQGREWLAGLPAVPHAAISSWNWAAALLACVALSWALDRVRVDRGASAAPTGRR